MHFIDLSKIYNDVASYLVVTVFGGLVTWIVALKRRVNTNEVLIKDNTAAHDKQIALILQRLDSSNDRIVSLSEDVRELRIDVRDIKNVRIGKN